MKRKGIIQIIVAIISLGISLYGLMWVFSSAILASGYCGSEFSLFHPEFRCKQPYIAMIMFVVFGISSVMFIWQGFKNLNGAGNGT